MSIERYKNGNDVQGLILDVRRNQGGNLNFGLEVAGRLTRGVSRQIMSERLWRKDQRCWFLCPGRNG